MEIRTCKLDKNSPVPLYYQLREQILKQIESGKARMEELEQIRSAALVELDSMHTMTGTEEIADAELAELSMLEVFDKNKLKVLIERVIVYDADAVEVVWKVDNPFRSDGSDISA